MMTSGDGPVKRRARLSSRMQGGGRGENARGTRHVRVPLVLSLLYPPLFLTHRAAPKSTCSLCGQSNCPKLDVHVLVPRAFTM